jgi:hypothetical protein
MQLMSTKENQRQLPLKAHMSQWLKTEEASQTYEALRGLDLIHHGCYRVSDLPELFNLPPEARQLSRREQNNWLSNQLPIEDIRHTLYIPAKDKLILSTPNQAWTHLNFTSLANISDYLTTDKLVCGTGAKIKSTRQKIFVPDHISSAIAGLAPKIMPDVDLKDFQSRSPNFVPALTVCLEALEKKGYVILIPDYNNQGRFEEKGKFTLLPREP